MVYKEGKQELLRGFRQFIRPLATAKERKRLLCKIIKRELGGRLFEVLDGVAGTSVFT